MIKEYEGTGKITKFVNDFLLGYDFNHGFVIREDKYIDLINKDGELTLKEKQDFVGGLIEIAYFVEDDNFMVIADEDGLLKDKKINVLAQKITGYNFVGDVLVLKRGTIK